MVLCADTAQSLSGTTMHAWQRGPAASLMGTRPQRGHVSVNVVVLGQTSSIWPE